MNLHEYQAKTLFARYGIPVPESTVIESVAQARELASSLLTNDFMLKAQAHTGGRGKAGGVKRISNRADLPSAVESLLGTRLVTNQTGPAGLPVNTLLLEPITQIKHEYYLSLLIDRTRRRIRIVASAHGGMDIEAVARDKPDEVVSELVDPALGVMPYQVRKLAHAMGLSHKQVLEFSSLLTKLHKLFVDCDASLVEINPLITTESGEWLALDAKFSIDENALYRQEDLAKLRDERQENAAELQARKSDFSYVHLDGEIGCMVNGAGLAMATMDLIKHLGGKPANFLDVGGAATASRVTEAFRLILSDSRVRAVLINIFGGIVRCDVIAQGIIDAVSDMKLTIPVVARLRGSKAEAGQAMLANSGLAIIAEPDLKKAAQTAIRLASA